MKINKIINYLNIHIESQPSVCVMLGSGLSHFANIINNKVHIPYDKIPDFFQTSVSGHIGEFIYGDINNIPILCAKGRFHYYEGYTFNQVSCIIEIFKNYSPSLSIITNSSGCLKLNWGIGDFMIANQFLDFSFLTSNIPEKIKVPKTKYYTRALKIAQENKIKLHEGVYTYTMGPSYETEDEIKEIIKHGGSAVGMSTFPEFLKCKQLHLNSIFISCLTNYGVGMSNNLINHNDVLLNADKYKK